MPNSRRSLFRAAPALLAVALAVSLTAASGGPARSASDSGSARMAIVRATSDKKTAAYVEVSCASTSTSHSDTTEMNVVVFR